MKIRRSSPLLLLLGSSLAGAQQYLDVANAPTNAVTTPTGAYPAAPTATRAYVGTEDAPVDGRDGKPHAGPFVDWENAKTRTTEGAGAAAATIVNSAARAVEESLNKFGVAAGAIPEKNDGVMNDENRPVAKKGTTGTEGGISEKTKDAQAGGNRNKAAEPRQDKVEVPVAVAGAPEGKTVQAVEDGGKKDAYGEGGIGMAKPADLPDSPRAKDSKPPQRGGVPVDQIDRSKWLVTSMPDTEGKTNLNPPKLKKPTSKPGSAKASSHGGSDDHETWHELFHSFVLSFAMIIFSEIGDKTFLIAALMAMRHSRLLVFSAALSALIAMTVLSAVLGHAFPTLLPKRLTTLAAALLFFVFGARSLHEGLNMAPHTGIGEEMREVEAELEEKEQESRQQRQASDLANGASDDDDSDADPYSLESGRGRPFAPKINRPGLLGHRGIKSHVKKSSKKSGLSTLAGLTNLFALLLSPAWVQTFVMTFLGEWGDRSQIATIAMAAGQDYWWVTLGAIVGHACCTGLAVIGGRALAGRVSMRVVTIGGAVAFLVFGVIYTYECIVE